MKVKIIKGFGWYKNEVGNEFEVSNKLTDLNEKLCYPVIQNNTVTRLCIDKDNCIIIEK